MKTNTKIIITFLILFISLLGISYIYDYNQKVNLAQYYYSIGDYQKVSELNINDISDKANAIISSSNWRLSSNKNDILSIEILLIHSRMSIYKTSDLDLYNKLKVYYSEIAVYLNTTENHLDEICSMSSEDSEKEIARLKLKT